MHGGNVWQGNDPAAWLDYSANIRPEGTPEWVRAALERAMDNLTYYPDPRMTRTREALGKALGLPPEYVLPTAGGISAIDLASHACGTKAVLTTPCFDEYEMVCRNRDLPIEKVSLLAKKHQIGDPAEILRGRIPSGGMVWLCNPLNPVGTAFSREQVIRLADEAERTGARLTVDEAFIEYHASGSVADLVRTREGLLVTGSMTKILGIPGVRLGYLCADPKVLDAVRGYQLTWELNCFAESVLLALPEHMDDIRTDERLNAGRRDRLAAALETLGWFVYPGRAPFLLVDTGRDVKPLVRALKEKHILVRECVNFDGINEGCHLRLAVKDDTSNSRLIAALKESLACAESR